MDKKYYKVAFIKAYRYAYGATFKQAEKVYNTADLDYIKAVIDSLRQDAKKAFYND